MSTLTDILIHSTTISVPFSHPWDLCVESNDELGNTNHWDDKLNDI
jgi:hypothetical protein